MARWAGAVEDMVAPTPGGLSGVFRGRRVLVTGHTGFKGSWLALWLHRMGADVTGYALAPDYESSHFELLRLDRYIHHIEADLRDLDALQNAFDAAKPEFVFHLAAQAVVRRSYDDPKTTFDTNVGGSVNVLEAVRHNPDVRALVYTTSDKCYLNKELERGYHEADELGGHDPYSASKAAAEMVFLAYSRSFLNAGCTAAASVRAGNVIGGSDWAADRIIPDCVRALEGGRPITLRNPNATRPWQHVLDPLNGYLCLAAALADDGDRFAGSWNFGPEPDGSVTVQEVAEQAIECWGGGKIEVDAPPDAPFEHQLLQLDITKAKVELGWRPVWHGPRAVQESVLWYKDVGGGRSAWDVSSTQIDLFSGEADD